ncbi:MAG: outer membrane beta-barrel protein [Hyphomicrobium sp.]|uniref:outer membrane protein n=1 Tax=Hyphomicrobium sp. TaxID=82 RepID=UPI0039E6C6C4
MSKSKTKSLLVLASFLAGGLASGTALAGEWNGFSFGAGGGYGMTNNEVKVGPRPETTGIGGGLDINGLGGTGGFFTLGAGYDHVLPNRFVVGAFIDYDFADIETEAALGIPPLDNLNASAKFRIDNQLSVGGRLGYLVSPSTLFFATGGYAHAETSNLDARLSSNSGSISGTLASVGSFNGHFFGGGVETLIGKGFSVKAEYRYTSLDAENATVLPGTIASEFVSASIKPQIQTARLSLNYRFGDGSHDEIVDPPPPVASSWTGAYLGIGSGYSVANNQATLQDRSPQPGSLFNVVIDGIGSDGGFISGTVGYDYQFAPRYVVGAFFDGDFSNLSHRNSLNLTDGVNSIGGGTTSEFDNILMVGARLGYLITPDTLLFGSVGYANAGMDPTNANFDLGGGNSGIELIDGRRFDGFFVGGGIETKIWDSLSLKAEYRYVDLGSENMTLLPNDLPEINQIISTKFDPNIQMGRISLNYRFGARAEPAPPLK